MTVDNEQLLCSPAPQRRQLLVQAKRASQARLSPILSPGNRRRKEIGDYWLGKTLGKGSSGRVKLGVHKITGQKVAVKIISKAHLHSNSSVEKSVKREIAVMKLIKHPNIMGLIDVIDLSDATNLYLILEYIEGGELFEYLISCGRLAENEARKYFQQIIFALDYCHRHLICHRDLKPENLLLDKYRNIKICDFGMASLQPQGSLLETSCGSPHYASPEIVNGIPYNGSASDLWSCGVILYALLNGHLPFDDDNMHHLLQKVKDGKYDMPNDISEQARDLIKKILVIDPEKRLTMQQVQLHEWFTAMPPGNPAILPDPPSKDEIGRPVRCKADIDDRILATLRDLWTELTVEQVIDALLSDEYNMQKVTYVLLQRHASDYWQKAHDDEIRAVTSPAKRRRPATICTVIPSQKEPFAGLNEMMFKLAESSPGPQSPVLKKSSDAVQLGDQEAGPATSPAPDAQPTTPAGVVPLSRSSSAEGIRFQRVSSEKEKNLDQDDDKTPPPPVPPKPRIVHMDALQLNKHTTIVSPVSPPLVPHVHPTTAPASRRSPFHNNTHHDHAGYAPTVLGAYVGSSSTHGRAYHAVAPIPSHHQHHLHHQNHQPHYNHAPSPHQQQQFHHYQIPFHPQTTHHHPHHPQHHSHVRGGWYPAHALPQHQQQQQQQQPLQHAHSRASYATNAAVPTISQHSLLFQGASSMDMMHCHHPACSSAATPPQQQFLPSSFYFYHPFQHGYGGAQPPPPPPLQGDHRTHDQHHHDSTRTAATSKLRGLMHQLRRGSTSAARQHQQHQHHQHINTNHNNKITPYPSHGVTTTHKQPHQMLLSPPATPALAHMQPSAMDNADKSNLQRRLSTKSTRSSISTSNGSRRSSWLPGLFYFKQPKVCVIDCLGTSENEMLQNIAYILERYMNGSLEQHHDHDRMRRRGEFTVIQDNKSVTIKFKLEVYQLPEFAMQMNSDDQGRFTFKLHFIQHQGDAAALTMGVQWIEQALENKSYLTSTNNPLPPAAALGLSVAK